MRLRVRVTKRFEPTTWTIIGVAALSLIGAFLANGLIFLAFGVPPLSAYQVFFRGAFGSAYALSETVKRMIPLAVIGAGLALSFQASVWNIGAEGQMLIGAVVGTWVALFSPLPPSLLLPAMFILGFLGGALWAAFAAWCKNKLAINEIITTLMLNYVAANLVLYLILGPWKGKTVRGFAYTDPFPKEAWLSTIGATRIPLLTLGVAFFAALLCYVVLVRTVFGFELKVVGRGGKAAQLAGIATERVVFFVMLLSGGLAGLAGVGEVSGIHHMLRHPAHISLGYGFTAVIVAWIARANPLGVLASAFLFGALMSGGDALKVSFGIPFQVIYVLNGLVLLFLIAGERLLHYRVTLSLVPWEEEEGEYRGVVD
ncbi:MAG: ABC transporter permease [Candidatus Caldatribacteriaceae bacterium]